MNCRFLPVALIVIGTVLLITGISAWQSVSSDVSRIVSGSPNTKSILLITGGILSVVIGGSLISRCK